MTLLRSQTGERSRSVTRGLAGLAAMLMVSAGSASAETPPPLEIEQSDVNQLGDVTAKWIFVTSQWQNPGTRIVDGETGKMLGMVQQAKLSNFATDPGGKYFYVAETMWTKGNRGVRQDMITVRDSHTLEIVKEIPLQGRLLVGFRQHNFGISADGRYGYVFNMDPASSIEVIDLKAFKSVQVVEVPGCALGAALPGKRVLSICTNGTLAVTSFDAKMNPTTDFSSEFFSAENDPVFDNSFVDAETGEATFLSYTGMIYSANLASGIDVAQGWSLQEKAGLPIGSNAPVQVNWLPGGRKPIAVNLASKRAYVLMHIGEFWSQKEDGREIWAVDLANQTVIARHALSEEQEASQIEVSQGDEPLLYLTAGDGTLIVLDADTFEERHSLRRLGPGGILQAGLGQ